MHDIKDLKRIDLADVHDPITLARLVHARLGSSTGPVPVVQIAKALDIVDVTLERLDGFEGMLLKDLVRSRGAILANTRNGNHRARFTVAHELGHFLLERHVLSKEGGFHCTEADLKETRTSAQHFKQEVEANRFAIELLAPSHRFETYLAEVPDLVAVPKLSRNLDLSKEAVARRYLELSDACIAMVFHHGGTIRYIEKSDEFPPLRIGKGKHLPPSIAQNLPQKTVTDRAQAEPKDWFDGPPMRDLFVQTLYQQKGYGITMLALRSFHGVAVPV